MTDERTPPKIVASAFDQSAALAAFIAQELEQWGFGIVAVSPGSRFLTVNADGYEFRVEVSRRA